LRALVFLAAIAWLVTARTEIVIAPEKITTWAKQSTLVPAQRLAIFELGTLDTGEAVGIQVHVANAVYKDLSVYVVDAPNMALARQNLQFRHVQGVSKKVAPFRVGVKIEALGPYYLVLDNRYAAVINKKVEFQVVQLRRLSTSEVQATKERLEKLYAGLRQMFVFKDFNVHVGNCGQPNAFSTLATGDVTLCNELIDQMSTRPDALTAVLLHELGHTLLNLWGLPNYKDEDVADQFATNILLRTGENGKRALSEWMQWFAEHNSRAQATNMLITGDTHSLSVQRIRNIQSDLKDASDLMRRWNNVLYPNMTDEALRSIAAKPAPFDDADSARKELARRGKAN
ncbi:MAG: DUF4344 domain-containing metallopeptidase, partial [Opitutaceae bacterium]